MSVCWKLCLVMAFWLILRFIASLGFPSWIKPKMRSLDNFLVLKIALISVALDCAQRFNLSNLVTPVREALTIFTSFLFWVWITLTGLYYQNWWKIAHPPLMFNSILINTARHSGLKCCERYLNFGYGEIQRILTCISTNWIFVFFSPGIKRIYFQDGFFFWRF